MHFSIIIPAFNEARLIESCLQSVSASLVANGKPDFISEIIVVDNNSTDNTAELARQAGARIVFEPVNQIGRAHNAGAAEATGDWLLASWTLRLWTGVSILFRWAAGALLVCRSDAFREVGGFNQQLYAAGEIDLCKALKKWGRQRDLQFVILTRHPLETSPRKMLPYSGWEMAGQMLCLILNPRGALQDKRQLPIWYDGRLLGHTWQGSEPVNGSWRDRWTAILFFFGDR